MRRVLFAFALLALTVGLARADWNPAAFSGEETLEFLTVADGEEHWSPVWLVVIDGQVYVRLGNRAGGRMDANATKPYVKVRVAAQEFDRVKAEPAPDMAEPVAAAMADKYWSDMFIRFVPHPYTMRLTPASN